MCMSRDHRDLNVTARPIRTGLQKPPEPKKSYISYNSWHSSKMSREERIREEEETMGNY